MKMSRDSLQKAIECGYSKNGFKWKYEDGRYGETLKASRKSDASEESDMDDGHGGEGMEVDERHKFE
jgi:hypothetical protein